MCATRPKESCFSVKTRFGSSTLATQTATLWFQFGHFIYAKYSSDPSDLQKQQSRNFVFMNEETNSRFLNFSKISEVAFEFSSKRIPVSRELQFTHSVSMNHRLFSQTLKQNSTQPSSLMSRDADLYRAANVPRIAWAEAPRDPSGSKILNSDPLILVIDDRRSRRGTSSRDS